MQGALQTCKQAEYHNCPAYELRCRSRKGRPKYRRWRVSKCPAAALRHRLYRQDVKERLKEYRGLFRLCGTAARGLLVARLPERRHRLCTQGRFQLYLVHPPARFVTQDDFDWAVAEATAKKKLDFSAVELLKVDEGLCVQCMHTGPYDSEPATVDAMHEYVTEQGYVPDFSDTRLHHEIYLSDPRKCAPEKLKTVVRHPIKRAE